MIPNHRTTPTELKKQHVLKEILFWQSPYCRSCGQLMVKVKINPSGYQPGNLATLEHIYPATDIRRHTSNGSRFWTLFCRKCNSSKGVSDSPGKMQSAYEKEFPAFDIRSLLTIHKTRKRWLYLLHKRKIALNKGKTFNIQQYR